MLPRLALTREGSTDLYVPSESLTAKEPKTHPAFFNPAARVNRDISVAVTAKSDPRTYLDALTGVGARGTRIANEASGKVHVTMIDFNEVSLEIAKRNAAENHLRERCSLVREEANLFLHSRFTRPEKFECVDVDPFGTPAPYVQGALVAASDRSLVSLTATDTAVLCGAYPAAAARRYGASLHRTEFMHEAAARALLGFCARVGGTHEIGIEPVAAHSTLHYLRVYFRVRRGAKAADGALAHLGYVTSCMSCHADSVSPTAVPTCASCGARVRPLGPLWVDRLVDEQLVAGAEAFCLSRGWKEAASTLHSLLGFDRFPPYAFSLERIGSRERLSSTPLEKVLESLGTRGFRAVRQPLGGGGDVVVKTDAPYSEVLGAVRDCSRYPRPTR